MTNPISFTRSTTHRCRSFGVLLAATLILATHDVARANPTGELTPESPVETAPMPLRPTVDNGGSELQWDPRWRRHQWFDYAYTGGLLVGASLELTLPEGNDVKRSGGVLFDDPIRDAFRFETDKNRNAMGTLSDVSMAVSAIYPTVVDAGIVALGVRGSSDVAWQMFLMDTQAFAFTSLTTGIIKRLIDRERPVATQCQTEPDYDDSCDSAGNHLSFPSGHTSIAFTGASLTCLHHTELKLYGGAGDTLACVSAMTVATLTGTARIVADKHYITDVAGGVFIGTLSGAILPWLLYYRGGGESDGQGARRMPGDTMLLPVATESQLGGAWVGRF